MARAASAPRHAEHVVGKLSADLGVPLDHGRDLLPSDGPTRGPRKRLAVFAIDDLTAEEEEEMLKYLAFLRSRKR